MMEVFGTSRSEIRGMTLRYIWELLQSKQDKVPKGPQTGEEVYKYMLDLGLQFIPANLTQEESAKHLAKAIQIAEKSREAFEADQRTKALAEVEAKLKAHRESMR